MVVIHDSISIGAGEVAACIGAMAQWLVVAVCKSLASVCGPHEEREEVHVTLGACSGVAVLQCFDGSRVASEECSEVDAALEARLSVSMSGGVAQLCDIGGG